MVKRYFDIGEAESLLPRVSPLMQRTQELKRELEKYEKVSLRQRIMTDGSETLDLGGEVLDSEYQGLKEEFYANVDKLTSMGCVVRDVDEGVIDFPSRFEGRDIFLCWHVGDRRIRHWHETDEGFSGRKRIVEFR